MTEPDNGTQRPRRGAGFSHNYPFYREFSGAFDRVVFDRSVASTAAAAAAAALSVFLVASDRIELIAFDLRYFSFFFVFLLLFLLSSHGIQWRNSTNPVTGQRLCYEIRESLGYLNPNSSRRFSRFLLSFRQPFHVHVHSQDDARCIAFSGLWTRLRPTPPSDARCNQHARYNSTNINRHQRSSSVPCFALSYSFLHCTNLTLMQLSIIINRLKNIQIHSNN